MNRPLTLLANLSDDDRRLVQAARAVSSHAYAPYSLFAVGAAVRTRSGQIHSGANLENASYGLSVCAELAAVAAANSAGDFEIEAIAVVGGPIPPAAIPDIVAPCGRCRQIIAEAAAVSETDIRVLSCSSDLSRIAVSTISELLPASFGASNLGRG